MGEGFQAGKIYELVYWAQAPAVAGLGLAAVRDTIAYAKYNHQSPFRVDRAMAFGVSQAGRFLRHFLYQGFNTDEHGRQVFDAMFIHAAGAGRGSFNHRFAQPSRDAERYSSFFFPTDLFPFTTRTQHDPETATDDGLLAHQHNPTHVPKIFFTNTGYEYWGRAASLIHTSVDGQSDVEPRPDERIYHLAGGQHAVGRFPPLHKERPPGVPAYRGNPLDFLVNLRALLVRLAQWVESGREPPASVYPRLTTGTLITTGQVRFPRLPGVPVPQVIHEAYRSDYGPHWPQGIITYQPPRLGKPFPTLVAQVDSYGNELGGIRNVELQVPVATYAPWHLRSDQVGGRNELADFVGTYIPLPHTEAERRHHNDPRPSLEALYPSRAIYLQRAREAAMTLVSQGYLLAEDVERVLKRAQEHWDWIGATK
jgi:hypothetical protein